jgi:amino acid efflux transporter
MERDILQNSVEFKATLKLPQVIALYIGAVLGSGILIIPGVAAEIAGPSSLISWGIMTVLVLPMALTMGLLSAKHPNAGGVSFFVTEAFNPHIGSLIGWFFLMAVVVGAPVLALTGAGYLCTAIGLGDSARLIIAAAILVAGLLTNYFGMKLAGKIQIAVVLTTLIVLIATIAGSLTHVTKANFAPFMPNGAGSVGYATTVLFWCFIGWEAVSHISVEFKNPRKDAIRGTIIAAVVVSVIYFLTAYIVVGTHSYGDKITDASLIYIIKNTFGIYGAVIAGAAALFICMAPAIAYIGAVSRLAYSLSINGYAPKPLSRLSKKYNTPLGGLIFLAICFAVLLVIFASRMITMSTLVQIPNAAFILTYLGGCAAGIKLLKGSKIGTIVSIVSLILTTAILLFVKWTILYPIIISVFWLAYCLAAKKFSSKTKTIK